MKVIDEKVEPFVNTRYESLDECSVAPDAWSYFASGRSLALLHKLHILHGDWRGENYIFDVANGAVSPVHMSTAGVASEAPSVKAADFVKPFSSMEADEFHSLLAGYVNHAWQAIEPHSPGYIDGFLSALGVTVERLDRPRATFANLPAIMQNLGLEIHVIDGGISLVGSREQVSLSCLDDHPRDSLVLLAGLASAGLDITALGRHEKLRFLRTDMGQHIALLIDHLSGRKPVELRPYYDSDHEKICAEYFVHLQNTLHYPTGKTARSSMAGMQVLQQTLVHADGEVSLSILDSIVDVADYVATQAAMFEAQAGIDQRHSQGAAQRSLLISLALGRDGLLDESRTLTMLQRHGPAGWCPCRSASAGKDDELTSMPLIPFYGAIVYLQSKGSVFRQRFQQSMQNDGETNFRWSCAWHALHIYRSTTQALATHVNHWNTRRKEATQLDGLLKMTVASYTGSLMAYAKGLQTLVDRIQAGHAVTITENFPSKFQLIIDELQAAGEFHKYMDQGSVKSRSGRKILQTLVDASMRSAGKAS